MVKASYIDSALEYAHSLYYDRVASSKKQATAVATVVLAASVDVALDCSSFAAIC